MAEAPYTTGQDILSYKGDANLATGSGQVDYNTNPNDAHPLAELNTTLGKLQDHDAHMQVLRYHQKIQDQKELAAMLAEIGGSAFNMAGANGKNMSFTPLPEDKEILDRKADEIRRMTLGNPSGYKYDNKILTAQQEFNALKNHASQRAIFYTQNNAEAAKENDEAERNAILQNNEFEVKKRKLTDYHTPAPHLNKLTFDPNNFIGKDQLQNKELQNDFNVAAGQDEKGNLIYTTKKGLGDNALDFRGKITPGSKLFPEAVNMAKSYLSSPLAQDVAAVTAFNNNVDKINQERGYAPGSPHFIPYISTVVQGQKGPEVKIASNNPKDIAYALMAEKYGALQEEKEVKKSATEMQKAATDIENVKNEMKNRNSNTAKSWADLKEKIREFDNPQNKGKATTEDLKEQQNMIAAASAYNDVHGILKNSTEGKKPVTNIIHPEFWKDAGIDPDKYNIYPEIPGGAADNLTGNQAPDIETVTADGAGSKTIKKSSGGTTGADRSYPVENKATKEMSIVYIKNGNVVSVVPERQLVINKLKHESNYDSKLYENKTVWVDKVYGGGAPASPAAPANDEDAIRQRLVPVQIKKKDGTIVDAMLDPVTNKRYAK